MSDVDERLRLDYDRTTDLLRGATVEAVRGT